MSEWISVKEAAGILGVHDRTIRRYISDGRLQSMKDGRRILVDKDSLTGLEDSRTENTDISDMIDHIEDHRQDHSVDQITQDIDGVEVTLLRDQIGRQTEEIQFLRDRIKELEDQRNAERERDQTIIMQLTRQAGDLQQALEASRQPWWRRLRLGKGKDKQD